MKKKQQLSIFLMLILSTSFMANSCGGETAEAPKETAPVNSVTVAEPTETAELSELELRQRIPDNLEDQDFKGRSFRLVVLDIREAEFHTDSLNGDVCNDALFTRDSKIESRFNCSISTIPVTTPSTFFNTMVQSGSDDAELLSINDFQTYSVTAAGTCMNWLDLEATDLSRPWYNQLANDDATINNRLLAVCSDYSVSSMTYTYAIFFNTRLTTNYDMTPEFLYDQVRGGKWTIDYFISITKDLYSDLNGNEKRDTDDLYGFGYVNYCPSDVWMAAFDQPLARVSSDGEVELTFMTDKTEAALQKIHDFAWNTDGFLLYPLKDQPNYEEIPMKNGTLVFAPLRFSAAFSTLRDMQDNYSILPFPKWDEAQPAYYTNADDKFQVFCLPQTLSDPEFVATIFEALSAESYRSVYPIYYDTALKGKYSSDPETAEMIDLIMAGRNFDFVFQYSESVFNRLPYIFREQLDRRDTNLASKWAGIEKSIQKRLGTFNEIYGIQ